MRMWVPLWVWKGEGGIKGKVAWDGKPEWMTKEVVTMEGKGSISSSLMNILPESGGFAEPQSHHKR